MKFLLLFSLNGLLLINSGFLFTWEAGFSDADYAQYTQQSFAGLAAANQEINLENIDYDLLNASIFYATNRQRALHHKPQFTFHPLLRDAAALQTNQMVKYNFFDHQNPKNPTLRALPDRLTSVKATEVFKGAGENLSEFFLMNYLPKQLFRVEKVDRKTVFVNHQTGEQIHPHTYLSFGEAIVQDWMTSPGHRANILNDTFTHLGCATLQSTQPGQFPKAKATQVFGRVK